MIAASLAMLAWHPVDAAPRERPRPPRASVRSGTPAQPAKRTAPPPATAPTLPPANDAEARLIEVYRLFNAGHSRQALSKAEALAAAYPHFQLAQLIHGDLLAARIPSVAGRGNGSLLPKSGDRTTLAELREEAQRRLSALRERPPPGTIPSEFLALSRQHRHAIAVDASRSRLYLLRNTPTGLQWVADYYVSIGKAGLDKLVEGDARTPQGIYYVTSNLDPRSLRDFYGAGALPLNYPNAYDLRRGRGGSGIWLHGTPPSHFARAPQATDGCVVMSNPDLQALLRIAEPGATPVVIARRLDWIAPAEAQARARAFDSTLSAWSEARTEGDLARLQDLYLPDHRRSGRLAERMPNISDEIDQLRGRRVELKDRSYLYWRDAGGMMVVTFGEIIAGEKFGRTRRQYWMRSGPRWKVFHEEFTG
ncbi:murein L,D-transpeptidase family protein [Variovorax sp. KK3]|uniref:L,D-transpeptidase family protein n=1 Tax=Variovorax sp. KK3 TaxID=1855728 RepID=UPI002118633F|nr:L,D-transpeptidase family protein [Variovorax sp. KK3]